MAIKKLAGVLLCLALIGLPAVADEKKTPEKSEPAPAKPDEAEKVWTNEDLEKLFGASEQAAGDEQPAPAPAKPDAAAPDEKAKLQVDAGTEKRRLAEAQKKVDEARKRVKALEEKVAEERAGAMRGMRSRRVVAPSQAELDQAKKELQQALAELKELRALPE